MNKPHLAIILASTRQARMGEHVAAWVQDIARQSTEAKFSLIDLRQENLPWYVSSEQPSQGEYPEARQREWATTISRYDGFLIVTPEYNHGYQAALKNALDLLYREWQFKPFVFVSYGGVAGGSRAVEQLRQVVIELRGVPLRDSLHLAFARKIFADGGRPEAVMTRQLGNVLTALVWWASFLHDGREQRPFPSPQ